jgi:hypothetical protein
MTMKPTNADKTKVTRATRSARVRAFARLGAYLAFAFVVLAVLALFRARASAGEAALSLGRELAQLGDVMTSTKQLVINGQTLFVSTASTDLEVDVVLDRFEEMCAEHATAVGEELARLSTSEKSALTHGSRARGLGILRTQEGDDEGTVACFANDEGGGAGAILSRVRELLRTGDLAALGRLRYVYATHTKRGGAAAPHTGTHVITVWADGPIRLGEMFPASGDATGSDSDLAPRPRDAKRLLSAQVTGEPYAVRVYDSALSSEAYFGEVTSEMDRAGWTHVAAPGTDNARGFLRGDGVEVVVSTAQQDDRMLVTILELGRGPTTDGR